MEWMIYGANGYTGELIAVEAKRQGMTPILAGRSAAKIAALASELKLPSKAFRLEAPSEIMEALRGVRLVLNCAGPFSKTADAMMRACIVERAHYLDITGESTFSRARIALTPRPKRLAWSCARAPASTWCRPTA